MNSLQYGLNHLSIAEDYYIEIYQESKMKEVPIPNGASDL